jgi:hypothetical protein
MNKKTHTLWTSATESKKTSSYHSPVARTQNSVARTRNTRSDSSNNSWNMMSTTVRMGMMNELQQNKTKTTIKQVRLPLYGVLGQHGSSRVDR